MKKNIVFILFLVSLISCGQHQEAKKEAQEIAHKYTNKLANESSPYLLQHAHNPVNWHPWGEEALTKAKKENKLIIISVGYAACHWCHVMEHESFENEEVAKYMNDNFVAIKIDREERPDIDQIYMDAIQILTGSGGWPLNAIALPDGRPIYGGTYFPKKDWLNMLQKIKSFVDENPDKAEQQAKGLTEDINNNEIILEAKETQTFNTTDLNKIFSGWEKIIDYKNGGRNNVPKFPMPVGYQFLLQYNYVTKNKNALKAVTSTLNKMADGGIYDQIGGGFSRYSTDGIWKVPHFEKMTYDNAQLVSLYASAYQATKNPYYKTIVYETLAFVERELTHNGEAFYSSLDADSEGEEGKFYVWKKEELKPILKDDYDLFANYYSVTDKGNWEHSNILHKQQSDEKTAKKFNITVKQLQEKIKAFKPILLAERAKRIRPGLDDKILTSWNALMLKGHVDAYRVFDDPKFLKTAIKNANFILKECKQADYRLNRNFKNGKSSINGFLDDYAFTIEAFISLYQATFDEKWLNEAHELLNYTLKHFYDTESGMFFYTSDVDPSLIARKMEISDNVIPSSNSQMAKNLFVLGKYFYKDVYVNRSEKMLSNVSSNTMAGHTFYANWAILMGWFVNEPHDVAIIGEDFLNKRKEFDQHYLPNAFLSGAKKESNLELLKNKYVSEQTTIYVCKKRVCQFPQTEVDKAIAQIKK